MGGPTVVAVLTQGRWIGLLLANQLWSLGGTPDTRQPINQSFVQAALTYTTPTRTTLFVSTETTYDYSAHQATVPLQLGVNQLVRLGRVPFQIGGPARYYAETLPGGPKWGFQIRPTFVLPR